MTEKSDIKKTTDEAAAAVSEKLETLKATLAHPSLREFLESYPPSQTTTVRADYEHVTTRMGVPHFSMPVPDIRLHCENENCGGPRIFRCDNHFHLHHKWDYRYIKYVCSNCGVETKTYALAGRLDPKVSGIITAYKFGELPVFGPLVPEKLKKLVGSDRELFFSGLRCESQGLGIGAFAYYRRVVEDRKNELLDALIKALSIHSPGHEIIAQLEAAKAERQFQSRRRLS